MVFKVVSFFLVLTEIVSVYGLQEKYIIENKETGMVWEWVNNTFPMAEWNNGDEQLFTLTPKNGGYSIGNTSSDQWLIVEQSKKVNMKYVIENKKTSKVLEETDGKLEMGIWKNKDSQLWMLKPHNKSGYSIVNAESGRILTYSKNGSEYEIWRLKNRGYARIQIEYPNIFLAHKNGKPVYVENKQNDDSDKWSLSERKSEKNGAAPTRLYVQGHQAKFVILNKRTGQVLSETDKTVQMEKLENRHSQLWILNPQNNSGYSIVNAATGKGLAYFKNGIRYDVWKLNKYDDTRIEIEDADVFLAHKGDKPVFIQYEQSDDSDRWSLIEQDSEESNWVYMDDYQEKFVIENRKTGMVLGVSRQFLEIEEWGDTYSQFWTLEPRNESGHFIIRNVANRGILTYNNNSRDYQIWKLNTQGETTIRVEDSDISLVDKGGEAAFTKNNQNDEGAKWVFIELSSKRANPKPIYVKAQQSVDIA
ncbi:uncharacterized protein LOC108916291 isoform X2 [Anoplophora glabripennis]|uniref:uncharacterized protein LOC108916291 isoform X2 n=1 Tax=Anoplophora glabripennis TaxID=217634 RepID=UPI000874CC5D|nr:uncharacterized protein LOC108916291 isoform X2 [Anoplophora glabripennis]